MTFEAIVLAGGLGTRLKEAVPNLPKSMAPVHGKPFLSYLIDHLIDQNVESFIFALGYRHEPITDFLDEQYPKLKKTYSIENEALGTGGAIRLACDKTTQSNVLALNGDTMFRVEVKSMFDFHQKYNAECTLALKPMKNFNRYGVVRTDSSGRIQSFMEKKLYTEGNINGGVYVLNVDQFKKHDFSKKFSFERDYLEKHHNDSQMFGMIQDEYFMDIGIPSDYAQFQKDVK